MAKNKQLDPGVFMHNGASITIQPNGLFRAKVNGVFVDAPSLAAIKARIGKGEEFPAFDAVMPPRYSDDSDEFSIVRIIGTRSATARERRWPGVAAMWVAIDGRTYGHVLRDSPVNRKIMTDARHRLAALQAQVNKLEKESRKIEESIKGETVPVKPRRTPKL